MQKEPWNTIPRLNLRPDTSHSLIAISIISYAKVLSSIHKKYLYFQLKSDILGKL